MQIQVPFLLQESFKFDGKTIRPIKYVADFVYVKDGITYVEDVKPSPILATADFKLKWKMLKNRYRDMYKYIIVYREKGNWVVSNN